MLCRVVEVLLKKNYIEQIYELNKIKILTISNIFKMYNKLVQKKISLI